MLSNTTHVRKSSWKQCVTVNIGKIQVHITRKSQEKNVINDLSFHAISA